MNDENLVPIYESPDVVRVEIIRSALADEGIDAVIENENQAALSGVLPARLFVRADDETRARAFIADHERPHAEDD